MRHSVLLRQRLPRRLSLHKLLLPTCRAKAALQLIQFKAPSPKKTFQTLLVGRALEKLGYTVNKPCEVDYNVGYTSLASGDNLHRRELDAAA